MKQQQRGKDSGMWLSRLQMHSCTQLVSNQTLWSFRVQIFVKDRTVEHLTSLSLKTLAQKPSASMGYSIVDTSMC